MDTSYHFTSQEDAIIATIAYFALFEYPLTIFEVWQYLLCAPQGGEIHAIDDIISTSARIHSVTQQKDGLIFLTGRGNDVSVRFDRYRDAEKKYIIARKAIRLLAGIPFVRLVCVVNRLSYSNSRPEGDIDLFIVARDTHVWLVRFLCTTLMHVLGKRPGQHSVSNALCLSFFISDKNLSLESLQLDSDYEGMPDIHFALWLTQFVPLYDEDGVYKRLVDTNGWVEKLVPNRITYTTHERRTVRLSGIQKFIKKTVEYFFSIGGIYTEVATRWYQMKFVALDIKKMVNKDTRVVMNDSVLKFHSNDRRQEVRDKFKTLLKVLCN